MNESTFDPIPTPEPAESASPSAPAADEPMFMLSGKKRRTIWPFIVIPLACLILLFGLVAFWFTRPKTILNQTLAGYAKTWMGDDSIFAALAEVEDAGKIHMELLNGKVHHSPIHFDLYAPSGRGRVAQLAVDGEKYRFYATPNAIMVAGSTLDGKVYGIKPEGIYQQFETSIFHPTAEGKYGIPLYKHELYDLEQALWEFERAYHAEEPTASVDFGGEYYDLLIDCLLDDADIEISEKGANREMVITLSPEALEEAIYSFFSALTTDEELIAYLDAYSPMDPQVDDFANWTEEFEWLMEQAEKSAENYRTLKVSLTVRMEYTPFSRRLKGLSVTLENEDGPMTRLSLDTIQTGYAVLSMSSKGTKTMEIRLTQNANEFRVELAGLTNRGTMLTVMDLHYLAEADGNYQLSLSMRDGNVPVEYILRGIKSEGDDVQRITLDHLQIKGTGEGDGTVKIGLTVDICEYAESPEIPRKYRNLMTITDWEMDAIAEQIGVKPDKLGEKLKEIIVSLTEDVPY